MNQLKINNTLGNNITKSGPVAQTIALHKGAVLNANTTSAGTAPLSFGSLKQAALGTTIIVHSIAIGGFEFDFTLNKKAGAADGSVAEALQKELDLVNVGDTALCRFFLSGFQLVVPANKIGVTSDDTSVTGSPAILFEGPSPDNNGEAVLEIVATAVPPAAPTCSLFSAENAFT
jgi:hypothetical protein